MLFSEIDLEQIEVDPPFNMWCASGHTASNTFKRSGPDSLPEPTRFFLVKSKKITGIYCEPCLVIAHWIAKQKRTKSDI